MLTPKFDIETLTSDENRVACIVPAGNLFALMKRSVAVPTGWLALVTRQGQDPLVVRAGGRCEEADARDVLFVRATPIECMTEESPLRSVDGFECRGSIRLHVKVIDEVGELAAFRKMVVGSGDAVSMADLQRYLRWPLGKVLSALASRLAAAELLRPLDASVVREAVKDKLGPTCLAGGLAVDGPAAVSFASPAYQEHCRDQAGAERQQRRMAARAQIQQALAAAQRDRLTHLVKMLKQMEEASARRADISVAELLKTYTEAERGELYGALWHLGPTGRTTRWVVAVSGSELLLFDPADLSRSTRRIGLPDGLGPLRSARVDPRSLEAGLLMVGAARGVHLVDIDGGQVARSLAADVAEPQTTRGGVNATAMSDDHVFASHSQLGLMMWSRDPAGGERSRSLRADLTQGASTVRCVQVAGLRLWFAVDQTLYALPVEEADAATPTRYAAGGSTISSVTVAGDQLYVGNVDGRIIAWDADDPETPRIVRGSGGGPVESIDFIETGGVIRLVIADRSRALMMIVVGDSFTCRYESPSQIVRRAAAAEDLFAAMNDSRDRLLAWDPREPQGPKASIVVPLLTGSTLQDICLVPSSS